jgi:ribosomal protein S18 acetylase RimI-like enzyme
LAGDASFLARAILIAGRAHVRKGIWEVILGGTEQESLAFLQAMSITEMPHLFHYSRYLVAEGPANERLGSLGGYDPARHGYGALRQAIPEAAQKLKIPPEAMGGTEERAARILRCLPKEIPGAWVIDSVATLPEHRGRGVADVLMERVLWEGKELGHSKAQVNVYLENEPAYRLYLKHGFEVVEEVRDAYFEAQIGSPGMMSLARNL